MSMNAWLLAVRNELRTALAIAPFSFAADEIMLMPGPEPAAYMGQEFISIYGTGWEPVDIDSNRAIDEGFSISAVLSRKSGFSPYDRQGAKLYAEISTSMDATCNRIMTTIDKSIAVMTVANTLMTGTNRALEYFRWLYTDPQPIPVPPSWFGATDDKKPIEGYIQEVKFGQARRKQVTGSAE